MRPKMVGLLARIALCAPVACLNSPAVSPTGAAIRYPIAQSTTASGMRVVYEVAPDFGTAGAVLVVGAGSADEPAGKGGLAHLVEHLVFDAQHGEATYRQRLQTLGIGDSNGFTTWDRTTFYAFGPAQNLAQVLSLFADVLDDPLAAVDEATFQRERQIVRNELRSRHENGTPGQAFGLLAADVFPSDHPYAHPIIGTEASIGGLTLEDARAFATAHYRAALCVLAISSPSALDHQKDLLEGALAGRSWAQRAEAPRLLARQGGAPPQTASHGIATRELPVPVPVLWLGWSIPSWPAPEADAATLVSTMIPDTFWEHVHDFDDDIAYVEADVEPGSKSSLFYVKATLKEGRNPAASVDSLIRTMRHGLGEQTYLATPFEAYKRYTATRLLGTEEPIVWRALHLAESMELAGAPTYLRSRAERTIALSSSTVADFYHQYLSADRAHVVLMRPAGGGRGERPGPTPAISSSPPDARIPGEPTPSSPADLRSWMHSPGLSNARRATLPNGFEVVILPRAGSPFHSVVILYRGGRASEEVPGVGVASLWAKQRISANTGAWAVEYSDRLDDDHTVEILRSAGSDLRATLRELHNENEFRIFWPPQQFLSRVEAFEKQDLSPEGTFERRLRQGLYGSHPYGRFTMSADLRKVAPKDVLLFLDAARRPENGVIVVVGDVDPSTAVEMVAADFGRSEGPGGRPPAALPAPPALETSAARPGSRIIVQNRPGATTASMDFRCLLPTIDGDTSAVASVFVHGVWESFFRELRERTATSYGVQSRVRVLRGGTAAVEVEGDVDYDHLPFAIAALRRFVEPPVTTLVDDAWLARGRNAAARSLNLAFGTTQQLALEIASLWEVGWPIETLDRYPENIDRADLASVVRLAAHCQANWVAGLLGDETRIRAALSGWAP